MSATTDQLANDARCIDQCIPNGEKLAVLVSIFYQITLQSPLSGSGSPLGKVTPAKVGQTYYDSAGNELWVANGLGAYNWVQPKIS